MNWDVAQTHSIVKINMNTLNNKSIQSSLQTVICMYDTNVKKIVLLLRYMIKGASGEFATNFLKGIEHHHDSTTGQIDNVHWGMWTNF